jgi:predicted CXXCH cytochrome family protein
MNFAIRGRTLRLAVAGAFAIFLTTILVTNLRGQDRPKPADPAAWGSNHAGKPIADYVHGDECLFCHRNDIGPSWQNSSHGAAVRQREDAADLKEVLKGVAALNKFEPDIGYFLGSRTHIRFLKKDGYGRFSLLSSRAVLKPDRTVPRQVERWVNAEQPAWDRDRFAAQCVGCHSTAVDSKSKTFGAFGLDCYTCHGNVDLNHTGDTSLIWLSKKRRSNVVAVMSICAQCHLRGGRSKSTGLPYPDNFVAGDNLFQDYQVDFARADDPNLNPGDRHIWKNVRDVVLYGSEIPTCTSCHQVHGALGSAKHRRSPRTAMCTECHNAEGPLNVIKPYTVHSPVCDY